MNNIAIGSKTYPVILNKENDGGYFVINPVFEGCYSQGESMEEALKNIQEATELCIEEEKDNQVATKKSFYEFTGIHTINIPQYA